MKYFLSAFLFLIFCIGWCYVGSSCLGFALKRCSALLSVRFCRWHKSYYAFFFAFICFLRFGLAGNVGSVCTLGRLPVEFYRTYLMGIFFWSAHDIGRVNDDDSDHLTLIIRFYMLLLVGSGKDWLGKEERKDGIGIGLGLESSIDMGHICYCTF